jgi:oligosaccharyltransferase complex subunit delta (ribophorin II)
LPLKERLNADQHSKFYLRFGLKSKNTPVEAHQTFVRFADQKSGREIIFLAQATNKQYSAEVDFSTNAKNFRHQSGIYTVELFVSDPLFENPIRTKLGDIKLTFLDNASSAAAAQNKATLHAPKPEIKHLFRPPEQTPPAIVSTVFTVLCLVPFALLLVLVNNKDVSFIFYRNQF